MATLAPSFFDWIFFVLVGNEDKHKISDDFHFGPNRTLHRSNFPMSNEKILNDL